ncbi:hypothetical protein, partial [Dysosmobacter sp.]|uniref:hypothetical protein n=1 Tax=Dysosmobacter sp. TaxID=2591382 RepID=UPI003A90A9A6
GATAVGRCWAWTDVFAAVKQSLQLNLRKKGQSQSGLPSACRKSLFSPLSKFSELYKSSEN